MYQDIRNKLNIIALSSVIELTYDKDSNTLLLPVNYNIQDFISIISHYSFPNLRILSTSLITKEVIEAIDAAKPNDVPKEMKVCAYCRVSTEEESQQSSYELQVQHYTQYIQDHENWTLQGIYADE